MRHDWISLKAAYVLADMLEPEPQPINSLCRRHGINSTAFQAGVMQRRTEWFEVSQDRQHGRKPAVHVSLTQAGRDAVVTLLEPLQFGGAS